MRIASVIWLLVQPVLASAYTFNGPTSSGCGGERMPVDACWRSVATADAIVVARVLEVRPRETEWHSAVLLDVKEAIKGVAQGTLVVRFDREGDSISSDQAAAFIGRDVIGLLEVGTDRRWYLVLKPLVPCDVLRVVGEDARTSSLFQEIRRQSTIAAVPMAAMPSSRPSVDETVAKLISQMVKRRSQEAAVRELIALGEEAVTSIVRRMDDQRGLPQRHLRIMTPGGMEGAAIYAPETVLDALAIILEAITGESFGSVHNGAADSVRKRVVAGWKTYVCQLPPSSARN